jgi:hypothetical protein
MIGFAILVLVFFAGLTWVRRRKGGNIVRIAPRGPFPPYDWFTHEQSPEEPYPRSDVSRSSGR